MSEWLDDINPDGDWLTGPEIGTRLILAEDAGGDLCVPILLRRGEPWWRGSPDGRNLLHRFYAWNSRRLRAVMMVDAG